MTSAVRLSKSTVITTYRGLMGPSQVLYDGAHAWVTNGNSNTVSKF